MSSLQEVAGKRAESGERHQELLANCRQLQFVFPSYIIHTLLVQLQGCGIFLIRGDKILLLSI